MKKYHTEIIIHQPKQVVWFFLTDFEKYPVWNPLIGKLTGDIREQGMIKTYIVPLKQLFSAHLVTYQQGEAMVWEGKQIAKFLLTVTHYYFLKEVDQQTTQLLHGEYFTGLFSYFIPKYVLQKMERVFRQHNEILKQLIEKK